MTNVPPADLLPAAPVQEQMWLVDKLDPEAAVYNEHLVFRLTGPLSVPALEAGFTLLVSRHTALRTILPVHRGGLRQCLVDPWTVRLDAPPDFSGRLDEAVEWARALIEEPYSSTVTPPVRFALARLGQDDHLLVLGFHHAVMDAGAAAQLLEELAVAMPAILEGREPQLPPVTADYLDFTRWHGKLLDSGELDGERHAWVEELSGAPHTLPIPEDRPRPATKGSRGSLAVLPFPAGIVPRLRRFSARHRVTPFHTLLAAVTAVLHRHTRADDMVVGICGDGRPQEYREVVGPFSCMIPVRMRAPGDLRFADLLAAARDVTLTAYERQFIPFRQVVNETLERRDPSRNPLVQVVFNAPPLHFREDTLPGLEMRTVHVPRGRSRFDLLFNLEWHGDDIVAAVEYDSEIFEAGTVRRFVDHFVSAMEAGMADPSVTLDDIRLTGRADTGPPRVTVEAAAADAAHRVLSTPAGPVVLRADDGAGEDGERGEVVSVPAPPAIREPNGAAAPRGLEGTLFTGPHEVALPEGDGALRVRLMEDGRLLWRVLNEPQARAGGAGASRSPALERRIVELCRELLEDDTIVAEDDFFAVGGHSMVAARLVQTLSEEFEAEIPLLFVFENPELHELSTAIAGRHPDVAAALEELERLTPEELAALAEEEREPEGADEDPAARDSSAVDGLGAAEEPFWLMEQFAPGSAVNTLTLSFRIDGPVDLPSLEWALNQAVARQEILRTTYHLGPDHTPHREVHDAHTVTVEVADLRGLDPSERTAALEHLTAVQAETGYDVSVLPLIRTTVVRLADEEQQLLLSCHHLVMDYWAVTRVLFPEISAFYRVRSTGQGQPPDKEPVSFRDVMAAERRWRATPAAEAQERYWRRRLTGLTELTLPTDFPRPAAPSFDGAAVHRLAPEAVRDAVHRFAAERRVTPFIVVATALSAVLHQWSGHEDVQLLTPCENRLDLAAADVMGAMVNLLVLRLDLGEGRVRTWADLLGQARDVVAGAYANQSYPAGEALRAAGLDALIASGRGSYVTLNVFQADSGFTLEGCRVHQGRIVADPSASTDLEVSTLIVEDGLLFDVKYRTALWERSTVERFAAACESAVTALITDPDAELPRVRGLL
ncbi:condensation domain-containing protein [Wenjunlia tyrosinilytica]|uniref:Carrier domain-containing protein n=1 Tax=Wenjunlia tyrosinilytica TaxID=1544741 RepID=A0A917ZU99_9ACTN|nr:condensation domain-containing protein [Wenjunlia tyrosinilytica]GGO94221.1 hypothetical protein GCM10012280_48560 [Wenjunlia tyrosinilytica]